MTAGSQPDWYLGWPDGLLRIMPPWETHVAGYTLSWNIIIPILVMPVLLWAVVLVLPFVEARITGDRGLHHVLQRPRDVPGRTSFMVALMTFYAVSWAAGGNDLLATQFHLSINQITWFLRGAVLLGPVAAFFVCRTVCRSLQHRDREREARGKESGVIERAPSGGYSERHLDSSSDVPEVVS